MARKQKPLTQEQLERKRERERKRRRSRNPEQKELQREYSAKVRRNMTPEQKESRRVSQREYLRYSLYGLTPEEQKTVIEGSGGVCEICKKTPKSEKELHIDHDHTTGDFRGILCAMCNKGIGMFKDSSETLRAAIAYLERPPLAELVEKYRKEAACLEAAA